MPDRNSNRLMPLNLLNHPTVFVLVKGQKLKIDIAIFFSIIVKDALRMFSDSWHK